MPQPEPVTPDGPTDVGRTLLTQSWLDLTFVHWSVDPAEVAPLLPPGTRPDTFDGVSHVGLVAFRMYRIGWFGLPGLPYLGTFPETNVRLYSVDGSGRRGVVFRSLEASRLAAVVAARVGFGLPYMWARMAIRHDRDDEGEIVAYSSRRRLPGPRGARCRLAVRVHEPVAEPSPLEHFLTARWALHHTVRGRLRHLPNTHPRWPLHRATLLDLDDDLVRAAGLPGVADREPVSVLYSPGVRARFGPAD